jgi:uncharacterized membrane protein
MAEFKKESHIRSLLKGISWRIVATSDTVVVVLFATWIMTGQPSIGDALKIGVYEFVIKLLVYYFHERIWEQIRTGDGLDKSRTLKKSISWRIVATSMTFLIASAVFNAVSWLALVVAGVEFVTKFILYYIHERIWIQLPLGKIRVFMFGKKA